MELTINLNSTKYVNEFIDMNIKNYVVGTSYFSFREAIQLSYEEIEELTARDINVYVLVNALIDESYLSDLEEHLYKLSTLNIKGVLFQDFGVLQICKENNYNFEMIYSPDTLNTNHMTLSVLKDQGINGAYLAREIPLNEKNHINNNVDLPCMIQIHGVEYMASSKRKLLSNYKEITKLEFNTSKDADIEIKANGVDDKCHIYEDKFGTHITSKNYLCCLDVLAQLTDFKWLLIDGLYIDPYQLVEIVYLYVQALQALEDGTYNKESKELLGLLYRLNPNSKYYHSFLFDSTVYKIDDVRKREENEKN